MTKALILAAGLGSRLYPLTSNKPKTLVPLFGESILLRQKKVLNALGINNISVVVGHMAKSIERLNFNCINNENYESTNMVSSFFCAKDFFSKKEDLIVSYGDIIYQKNNLKKLLKSSEEISVMVDKDWLRYWNLRFTDPLSDAESLIINSDNSIKDIGKKTDDYKNIQGQYTGLLKIKSSSIMNILDFYNNLDKNKIYYKKKFNELDFTTFLQILIDHAWKVYAVTVSNGWLEIDSKTDLNLYEKLEKKGMLNKFFNLND